MGSEVWYRDGADSMPPAITKSEHAYQAIKRKILDGELMAGDALDQEAMAAALSLSVTPVREALRRLESEKLVISRAHRSTEIAGVSLESLQHTYGARIILDTRAAELAAELATPAQLKEMKVAAKLPRRQDNPLERLHKNRAFHRAIYSSCGNPVLTEVLDSLWDVSDRFRIVVIRNSPASEVARQEHDLILEAIEARDSARAGELMKKHLEASLETITRLANAQQTTSNGLRESPAPPR